MTVKQVPIETWSYSASPGVQFDRQICFVYDDAQSNVNAQFRALKHSQWVQVCTLTSREIDIEMVPISEKIKRVLAAREAAEGRPFESDIKRLSDYNAQDQARIIGELYPKGARRLQITNAPDLSADGVERITRITIYEP